MSKIILKQPNLFAYATSELSQDAFICWLLEWARPENKFHNASLNALGVAFLDLLLAKCGETKPANYTEIEITRQFGSKKDRLDIFVLVDKKYAVLIEDKTNTKNFGDQLIRYYALVEKYLAKKGYTDITMIPIYFKTGDQSHYTHVHNSGFEVFNRQDILNLFVAYPSENNILNDYNRHLLAIEKAVGAYKESLIAREKEWGRSAWKGFYMALKDAGVKGNWDYVPNPSRGFMGFWGHSKLVDGIELKLQLEEKDLCFKIKVGDKAEQKKWRHVFYHKVMKHHADSNSSLVIVKPKRFGKGTYMTVAKIADYRIADNDGKLDMNRTVEHIHQAERFIDGIG